MGNNLSGLNPVVGVTVEKALVDFKDWSHIGVLGNSRFFKVSRIKFQDGNYGVLKVFKYPEPLKAQIERYSEMTQSYCNNNSNLTNILPYSGCSVVRDIVILWRKYVEYSLYERLSLRPFLKLEEKKWIAFQILCGLTQCHRERLTQHYYDNYSHEAQIRLCHGDLKIENIMLTDWGWVLLADMAPFKPVYIPQNNPGEFYFFFDISGRRACSIAPERFVSALSITGSSNLRHGGVSGSSSSPYEIADHSSTPKSAGSGALKDDVDYSGSPSDHYDKYDPLRFNLKPSMDMFSTGCVFLELFTDGVVPFNLAELFNYRDKDSSKLEQLLQRIQDRHVVELIRRLLDKNPETRITAEDCLISQRGKMFPDVFYRELKSYMVQFTNPSFSEPDTRIKRLYADIPQILETYVAHKAGRHPKNNILILFINLITSVIYEITEERNMIRSLMMMQELALYMTDQVSNERIIPYLLEFVDSHYSNNVRCTALNCAYHAVLDTLPSSPSDVSFFPEVFLPVVLTAQRDTSLDVQMTFTRLIPGLARTAQNFLVESIKLQNKNKKDTDNNNRINYDEELARLREIFREMIINLFLLEQNVGLKCCITNRDYLEQLTQFFSVSKARDDLLSHLITFLNDKTNSIVRITFYESLPDIISIMGVHSAKVLEALLIQGLISDPSIRVVEACCRSLAIAGRNNLLPDALRANAMIYVVNLLALPYICIRLAAIDYIITFYRTGEYPKVLGSFIKAATNTAFVSELKDLESSCIFKTINPYSFDAHCESTFLNNLHDPIPRLIFDDLIKQIDIESFFQFLSSKHKFSVAYKSGQVLIDSLYERLVKNGMSNLNEKQLLLLDKLIIGLSTSRRQPHTTNINEESTNKLIMPNGTGLSASKRPHLKGATSFYTTDEMNPEALACLEIEMDSSNSYSFNKSSSWNKKYDYDPDSFINDSDVLRKWTLSSMVQENSTWESMFQNSSSTQGKYNTRHERKLKPGIGSKVDLIREAEREYDDDDDDEDDDDINDDDWTSTLDKVIGVQSFRDSVIRCLITGSSAPISHPHSTSSPIPPRHTINSTVSVDTSGNIKSTCNDQIGQSNQQQSQPTITSTTMSSQLQQDLSQIKRSGFSTTVNLINGDGYILPTAWKPKGILVSHLHEHQRGYTSILAHPSDKFFISCGSDKMLRFWNCDSNPTRIDPTFSKYIPNKSMCSLPLVHDSSVIKSLCLKPVWLDNGNTVASVVDGRFVNIASTQVGLTSGSEMRGVYEFPIDDFGRICSLAAPVSTGTQLDSASRHTLLYASTGNWLIAHDTRCQLEPPNRTVWTHKQSNDYGMITSCAIHSPYTWLVTATSRGCLVCWDLRFQRVISKIEHPDRLGFLSVLINPLYSGYKGGDDLIGSVSNTRSREFIGDNVVSNQLHSDLQHSQIWASAEMSNEIACWNLERSVRSLTLRTTENQMKPLNNNTSSNTSSIKQSKAFIVRLSGQDERKPCIISGSSDMNLRYWDLSGSLSASTISVGGLDQYAYHYSSSHNVTIDDNISSSQRLLLEHTQTQKIVPQKLEFGNSKKNFLQTYTGHMSSICDMATVDLGQPFILSSSLDGIIKMWK